MPDNIAIPITGQSPDHAFVPHRHPLHGVSPSRSVRSLYIHIPFCFHKCHYCDFYSIVDSRDRQNAFTDRLIAELAELAPFAGPLETVFVGGGTPTLLVPACWDRLIRAIDGFFDLSPIRRGRGEWTVECNPETAEPDLLVLLADAGVNRISIGAQSFQPRLLKVLERWHQPSSVAIAVERARRAGIERISLDLIFAICTQTLEELESDLDEALALEPSHMSCYALTYEPNTPLTRRVRMGQVSPVEESLEVAMYERVIERLAERGLDRYEVSNFARQGHECAHNLVYWRQEPWLCAGPSASGHVAGWRWKDIPHLGRYLASGDGLPPAIDVEEPDSARALGERLMTGLRLREGVPWCEVEDAARTIAPDLSSHLARVREKWIDQGCLQRAGDRVVPTPSGFLFADAIARDLLAVLC